MTCGTPRSWQSCRAAITALGEQQARSASGPFGSSQRRSVTPTGSGPDSSSATALSTPPLIADGDSVAVRARSDRRADRVRERVDRQRLAADRRSLEERQAAQVLGEPGGVGVDDHVAVDAQPNCRPVGAARGVSEELDHSARVESAPTPPTGAAAV